MYIYEPARQVRVHVKKFDFHKTVKPLVTFVSKIVLMFLFLKKQTFTRIPGIKSLTKYLLPIISKCYLL